MRAVVVDQKMTPLEALRKVGTNAVQVCDLLPIALIGHGIAVPRLTQVKRETPFTSIRSNRFTSVPQIIRLNED